MTVYYINLYPKGQLGNGDEPEVYAYNTDAYRPIGEHGFRIKVTLPEPTAEIVKSP